MRPVRSNQKCLALEFRVESISDVNVGGGREGLLGLLPDECTFEQNSFPLLLPRLLLPIYASSLLLTTSSTWPPSPLPPPSHLLPLPLLHPPPAPPIQNFPTRCRSSNFRQMATLPRLSAGQMGGRDGKMGGWIDGWSERWPDRATD